MNQIPNIEDGEWVWIKEDRWHQTWLHKEHGERQINTELLNFILHQQLQKARVEGYEQGYTQGKFDEKMDAEYKHPEELQKARHDWLREEIVKLQDQQGRWVAGYAPATNGDDLSKWGFRTEQQAWDYIKKTHLCKPNCEACEAEWLVYTEPNTDQALQTIIDRYHSELDQPTDEEQYLRNEHRT